MWWPLLAILLQLHSASCLQLVPKVPCKYSACAGPDAASGRKWHFSFDVNGVSPVKENGPDDVGTSTLTGIWGFFTSTPGEEKIRNYNGYCWLEILKIVS